MLRTADKTLSVGRISEKDLHDIIKESDKVVTF